MRIAVCDDEKLMLDKMKLCLEKYMQEKEFRADISYYESGEELLKNIYDKIDIYILDVEMKELNGIETAKKIRELDQQAIIIFATAHLEYATKGYSVKAYRYLLKPISYNDIKKELDGAMQSVFMHKTKVMVKVSANSALMVNVDDIYYITTYNHITKYIIPNGQDLTTKEALSKIEVMPEFHGFYRIHNSYLVSMDKIEKFTSNEVTLKNGDVIPMSRNRAKKFKQLIMKSWERKLV